MISNLNQLYDIFIASSGITTDTRNIEPNHLFFALKGDRFNGNAFAAKAIESGALAAVIDEPAYFIAEKTILVPNVLEALQGLAALHRSKFKGTVIALTGSNGKTTSKELLNAVLSSHYNTLCTIGNLNNHIGVPLTLLRIRSEHEIAIVEMGANHQKEIDSYCQWVKPDIGIITNIGKAHLEGFGGIEGVIKGKTELYRFIEQYGGTLWVNADDALLVEKSKNISRAFYGIRNDQFTLKQNNNGSEFLHLEIQCHEADYLMRTQLTGAYNISNIALAIYAGIYFKIPIQTIIVQIEAYAPTNSRSQIIKGSDYTIILDAYNANPSSMTAAILNLKQAKGNTVAYLGGMRELGEETLVEHLAIGTLLKQTQINEVILVGAEFKETALQNHFTFFENSEAAKNHFKVLNKTGKTILIKGSRGSAMEKILD
jgi:UDP-N-acetylmuramoyl-tripeptide--D-alanyl-D-alanine ligase